MAKLTDEHKAFMVQRLALYDSASTVSKAMKEAFNLDVPRGQVEGYDPASYRAITGHLAAKWKVLFEETRAAFRETIDMIPIADRSFRLRRLGQMHDAAFEKGAHVIAAQYLEQAAKEVGNAFGNTRKLEHSGSVKTGNDDLSKEDKRAALIDRVAEAMVGAQMTRQ